MKNKLFTIMPVAALICIAIFIGVFIGRMSSKTITNIAPTPAPASNSAVKTKPLNINIITEDDLVTYLQIRRSLAREIVNYRKTYGDYVYISELKNVPGMTDEVYQQIKPYLTLSD